MKHVACTMVFVAAVGGALPAWGVPQGAHIEEVAVHPAQAAGMSVAAAAANLIYFPVRLAVTIVMAEAGGVTAWLSGGDRRSADALWDVTEGQAFITPAILEGQERLRFGR